MMNLETLAYVAAGVALLALIALAIMLGIRLLCPRTAPLPVADALGDQPAEQAKQSVSGGMEETQARPPGAENVEEGYLGAGNGGEPGLPVQVGYAQVAGLVVTKPDMICIHHPVKRTREEVLRDANEARTEEAVKKAANSRRAVVMGIQEELAAKDFGYANVRGMKRAWKRYNV